MNGQFMLKTSHELVRKLRCLDPIAASLLLLNSVTVNEMVASYLADIITLYMVVPYMLYILSRFLRLPERLWHWFRRCYIRWRKGAKFLNPEFDAILFGIEWRVVQLSFMVLFTLEAFSLPFLIINSSSVSLILTSGITILVILVVTLIEIAFCIYFIRRTVKKLGLIEYVALRNITVNDVHRLSEKRKVLGITILKLIIYAALLFMLGLFYYIVPVFLTLNLLELVIKAENVLLVSLAVEIISLIVLFFFLGFAALVGGPIFGDVSFINTHIRLLGENEMLKRWIEALVK